MNCVDKITKIEILSLDECDDIIVELHNRFLNEDISYIIENFKILICSKVAMVDYDKCEEFFTLVLDRINKAYQTIMNEMKYAPNTLSQKNIENINIIFKEGLEYYSETNHFCSKPKMLIYQEVLNIISINISYCKLNNMENNDTKNIQFLEKLFKSSNELLTLLLKVSQKLVMKDANEIIIYKPLIEMILEKLSILAQNIKQLALVLAVFVWKIYFNLTFGNFEELSINYNFSSVLTYMTSVIIDNYGKSINGMSDHGVMGEKGKKEQKFVQFLSKLYFTFCESYLERIQTLLILPSSHRSTLEIVIDFYLSLQRLQMASNYRAMIVGTDGMSQFAPETLDKFPLLNSFLLTDLEGSANAIKDYMEKIRDELASPPGRYDTSDIYLRYLSLCLIIYRLCDTIYHHESRNTLDDALTNGPKLPEPSLRAILSDGLPKRVCLPDTILKTIYELASLAHGLEFSPENVVDQVRTSTNKPNLNHGFTGCPKFPDLPLELIDGRYRLVQPWKLCRILYTFPCLTWNDAIDKRPKILGDMTTTALPTQDGGQHFIGRVLLEPLYRALKELDPSDSPSCKDFENGGCLTKDLVTSISVSAEWLYTYFRLSKTFGPNQTTIDTVVELMGMNRFRRWCEYSATADRRSRADSESTLVGTVLRGVLETAIGHTAIKKVVMDQNDVNSFEVFRYDGSLYGGKKRAINLDSLPKILMACGRELAKLLRDGSDNWTAYSLFLMNDIFECAESMLRSLSQQPSITIHEILREYSGAVYQFTVPYFSSFTTLPWNSIENAGLTTTTICERCCCSWLRVSQYLHTLGQPCLRDQIMDNYRDLLKHSFTLNNAVRLIVKDYCKDIELSHCNESGCITEPYPKANLNHEPQNLSSSNFTLEIEDSDNSSDSQKSGGGLENVKDDGMMDDLVTKARQLSQNVARGLSLDAEQANKLRLVKDMLATMLEKT